MFPSFDGLAAFVLSFGLQTPAMHDHPIMTAGAGVFRLSHTRSRTRRRNPARPLFTPAVRMAGVAATLRHQRSGGFNREVELQEVIAAIEARLASIAPIRSREFDDKLDAIERQAAPYALAFLYEIRRLEKLLRRRLMAGGGA
jgi:hypothetical protein